MIYEIENLTNLKVIRVTVNGTLNPVTRENLHSKAVNELNINGYSRLLVDVRNSKLIDDHTAGDSISLANYMKEFEMPDKLKLAFVSSGTDSTHKIFVKFSQVITDFNIKHFTCYDEAIDWLCME